MGKEKTGRPYDVPISVHPRWMDLELRNLYIPPGSIRFMFSGDLRQTTKTTTFTAGNEVVILADARSSNITITLPATSAKANKTYWIKKIDTTHHIVKIKGNIPSETIDGEKSIEISIPYTCITIICDGSDWWII